MHALESWHDFFVLVGTAGATLLALLFVAVSLGAGFLSDRRTDATRAFFSPVVVHFSAVFFLSAIALVPGHRTVFFSSRHQCLRVDRFLRCNLRNDPAHAA